MSTAERKPPATAGSPHDEGETRGLRQRMHLESRRIGSQHAQLDEFYAMVVHALGNGAVHSAREAFSRFEDALRAHFEIEEALYFPALRTLAPDAAPVLARLIEEHTGFTDICRRIRLLLRAGECELSAEQLSSLAQGLADHERREEALAASAAVRRDEDPG